MEPRSRVEYYTAEGQLIEYQLTGDIIQDLDNVARLYYENTNRFPEYIFMDTVFYADMCKKLFVQAGYVNGAFSNNIPVSHNTISIWLSTGNFNVKPIPELYCTIFVGSKTEMEQNNIDKLFEDIVLKDCDRI